MLEIVFIIRGILNSRARPSTKTTEIGSPRIKSISQYFIYYCLFCLYHNFLYCMLVFTRAREITRTNYCHQYRCDHTCENASMKLIMVWFVHTKFCKQSNITSILVKEIQIMSDSHFQYTSNQNQFQNDYDGRKTLYVDIKQPLRLSI